MSYERTLSALGRLLDERRMRNVSLVQTATGIMVTGLELVSGYEQSLWRVSTFEVPESELSRLVQQHARDRADEAPKRPRWFG